MPKDIFYKFGFPTVKKFIKHRDKITKEIKFLCDIEDSMNETIMENDFQTKFMQEIRQNNNLSEPEKCKMCGGDNKIDYSIYSYIDALKIIEENDGIDYDNFEKKLYKEQEVKTGFCERRCVRTLLDFMIIQSYIRKLDDSFFVLKK